MASDDQTLAALSRSKVQLPDGTYVAHRAYEKINEQVKAGRPWAKCPNCGDPYPLDREGADGTMCSTECWDDYAAYVQNPGGGW